MVYNSFVQLTNRIEEAKALINGISEDAQKILSIVQFSVPAVEGIVQKVIDRAEEVKKIFSAEESHGRKA